MALETQCFRLYMHINQSTHLQGVLKKMTQIVLSELCQISIKFDNFWHTDSQDDRNM